MKIKIYNDLGVSKESIKHCEYTLKLYTPQYKVEYISAKEILEENWFKDTYLLVLPGGRDLYYVQKLQGKGNANIKNYIKNGGNFLGICAGSYYSGNYLEFAKGTNIEVIGKRELEIFKGTVKGPLLALYYYNLNKGARAAYLRINPIIGLNIKDCYVFYNGGGYFVDAENTKDTEIIASYEDNKAAIIKCMYGNGTAILSGVHLEYDPMLIKNKSLNNICKTLTAHNIVRIKLLNYLFRCSLT
ncbi:BPL-N domain-containing protein [Candidatus Tisiphia endosymbiont of Parasteatoda lunata]|uniref:BPL-N domain-containing protein n=1 Tax=Candidatus Tisiphia endosymbiont of Parasteatoda lunata TaxID=3066275 RepID=UPI00313B67D8